MEATTPNDEALAVERDAAIEVLFSAPLDPKTVTSDAFSVIGPTGVVSGKLSVSGSKATFTPSAAWSLLADYTVDLASTIRSEQGVPLSDRHDFAFQTRDGVFRKPERLTTMTTVNLQVVGSRAGHVAAVWSDWNDDLKPRSTFGVMFDPQSAKWGKVAPIASDGLNEYSFAGIGLNDRGQAFAVAGSTQGAWNRFNGAAWGIPSTTNVSENRDCALADDGTAMTVWEDIVGEQWQVFAQSVSAENKWATTETLQIGARIAGVKRFASGFIAFYMLNAEQSFYARVYDPKQGWLEAKRVTPVGSNPNYSSFATNDTTALVTWWDAGGMEKAALFNRLSWTSQELGPALGGSRASLGQRGHIAAWVHQKTLYASRYDLTAGWADPLKLGGTTSEFGPGAEIDASGNALAAWADGSSVTWRRSPHSSSGWGDAQHWMDQDASDVYSSVNPSSGEVMLVWRNPLGVWATRFE